jgi:pimeloyl-ACP methyl ester carboxylesterase
VAPARRIGAALAAVALATACMPPSWGANALLHPARRPVGAVPVTPHRDVTVESDGLKLRGWLFPAAGAPRHGVTVVYLHGVGDTRASGIGIAGQLVRQGFDVAAFDSRAHGESDGAACTYGFHEKRDLARILDALGARRVVLVGASLGAAVALQEAPEDHRVVAVVAAASFSDLATVARERVRWVATDGQVEDALALAEREGAFQVAAVSPVLAAARIRVPVLLVHGEDDGQTSVAHSRRIFTALAGPKEYRQIPGAGHNDALTRAWPGVERWIHEVARPEP